MMIITSLDNQDGDRLNKLDMLNLAAMRNNVTIYCPSVNDDGVERGHLFNPP